MKLRVVPSFVFVFLFSIVVMDGCRTYDPAGPDTPGGTSMNPGSAGILRVHAISALGSSGDFEIDLFVVDSGGNLISNLPDSLFTMLQTSLDTAIAFLGSSSGTTSTLGPYSAELLLDQSLSMESNDPMDLRLKGAWIFMHGVDALRGGVDEVQLSSFCGYYPSGPTDGLLSYGPFTNSGASFDAALQSLAGNLGYATPLYDAMYRETDSLLAQSVNTNKALIVFTDGDDNASSHSLNDAIQHAEANNVKVFAIALKTGLIIDSLFNQMPHDGSGSKALFSIAMATGGAVMHTNDAAQAVSYYAGLGQVLHGNAPYFKTRWHVTLPAGSMLAGSEIRGQLDIKGSPVEAPFIVQF
jgi:hypothetical protein